MKAVELNRVDPLLDVRHRRAGCSALKTTRRAIKSWLVAVVVSTSLADSLAAGPLDDGQAAYDRGNYATALLLWRPLAEQGDASAQYSLGVMYDHGQGVPRNYSEALAWFRKAAELGHAGAQYNLGAMYAEGQGVPRDYVLAYMWLNLAATSGNRTALRNRDIAAGHLSPGQIAEAERLARERNPK